MQRALRVAAASAAALLVIFGQSGSARAQAADKATAEVLFNQGKALLAEGKLAEACPKLAESLRLDTGIGTMLYLAECYERSGKTASAWAEFREAQATASKEGDARERIAKDRADLLEPKLAHLAVVVPPASDVDGLVVTRDGSPIGRAGWGVEAPVDPGRHVIRAEAPGRHASESTIEIAPGAPSRFVVPALAIVATPPPDAARASSGDRPQVPPPDGSRQRTIAIGLAAAGVVALGVGTFFGLRAVSALDEADSHCNDQTCDQRGLDLRDRSKSRANVATVLFIVGGAAVAGGGVIWLTAPRRAAASASASGSAAGLRSIAIAPMATPSSASLSATLHF